MKTLNKILFFSLMICLGFVYTSCSDDSDSKGSKDQTEEEGDGTYGYFSVTLTTNPKTQSTKATVEDGDKEEAVVDGGFIALYNKTTKRLEYRFDLDISNGDGSTIFTGGSVSGEAVSSPNSKDRVTTTAQYILKKEYDMLVVLNPTAAMLAATVQANKPYFSQFEAASSNALTTYADATSKAPIWTKIAMSNNRGLVPVTTAMFYTTKEDAEKATNVPVIGVDRIVSKVTFVKDAAMQILPAGAAFGVATWQLDITNKRTYWLRKKTKVAPVEGDKHEDDPSYAVIAADRDYLYAEDPNWDGMSNDRIIDASGIPTVDLSTQFNFLAPGTTSTGFTQTLGNTATREYALENTMAAAEQWEDVTTRVLIRGNYIPKAENGVTFAADESYYFYAGTAFKHSQIKAMIDDEDANPWPSDPVGLKEAVAAAVTAGDFDFSVATEPAASKTSADGSITFYRDGVSYYYILVRHFSDALSGQLMGFGRYGIVRNNVYKVNLTQVSGPGTPTIPEPEGPDDKEKGYIAAQIQVLPWVVRTQDAEI